LQLIIGFVLGFFVGGTFGAAALAVVVASRRPPRRSTEYE